MPGGDRTGPNGEGPMTGRAAGYCGGNGAPGYASPRGYGRGFGFRRGGGMGFGRGRRWGGGWGRPYAGGYAPNAYPQDPYFAAPADPANEMTFLKNQADALKRELDAIAKRISDLEVDPE